MAEMEGERNRYDEKAAGWFYRILFSLVTAMCRPPGTRSTTPCPSDGSPLWMLKSRPGRKHGHDIAGRTRSARKGRTDERCASSNRNPIANAVRKLSEQVPWRGAWPWKEWTAGWQQH